MVRALIVFASLCAAQPGATVAQPFTWDNAVIYFVMTDRFANGDPANDHEYGRGLDSEGRIVHADSPGRFFGGDLQGLTQKVSEGYFTELGVNAIWITSPLEQIRGWVGGEDGSYPAYAYHGYWPLDFTRVDRNVGTEDDLRSFVDACHSKDIRVLMDVVVNHAGYNTLQDMADLDFGALRSDGWRDWEPAPGGSWHDYHDLFIDYGDSTAWSSWWGGWWIRAGIAGYPPCGSSDRTTCTSSLPDFRTESSEIVPLPDFLVRKWADDNSADSTWTPDVPESSVSGHIVRWLVQWVRKLGIDGFRLDTAKHLDAATISLLKTNAVAALRKWKSLNPDLSVDPLDFWMVGEVFGHGVDRSEYFDSGLDAVINFSFQHDLERGAPLDSLYSDYASRIGGDPSFNVVSYISSHDTHLYERDRLRDAATALMLVPGNVQIFYGDETGRRPGADRLSNHERTRSSMNWDEIDEALLAHWRRLGRFRRRHPAVAMGIHEVLSDEPYTFSRSLAYGTDRDRVVVVLGQPGRATINVSKVFGDNTIVRDAYSGQTRFVSYGMISVDIGDGGVVLLEEVQQP